ncbi:protein PER1 [Colletotrichum spaethianum]|uniref:Post-GPI attachment to proteins factor 3 n=1 Tax=Colletotrichum spaethianum TaxID=700344 RepID=A0AA37P6M5_9PEZI|nr:protein PER1 [Colletotrichum spaethianum]GKT40039.1 protein PER1 [Colletotrichum spaethianum]
MKGSRAGRRSQSPLFLVLFVALLVFAVTVEASYGDRLPEFRECVQVGTITRARATSSVSVTMRIALQAKKPRRSHSATVALHRRLLLWSCASECDYTCQHIITKQRVAAGEPVVQFHGKWPFYRFLGVQEPFSTLFSLGNLWAHHDGWRKLRAVIPASYPLRPWYEWLAGVGIASWTFSAIFHTRDFVATEQLDYFAAGASVLYGLYYTVVRIMRLDLPTPRRRSVLRAWTLLCVLLYAGHVAYLKGVRWDYTYNMTANVIIGMIQNVMWLWFSFNKYRQSRRGWAIWPSIVVASVITVMSLELFDFPPLWGALDAHSLWHLGTIPPTILMYRFLVKDAQDDMAGSERLKS